MSVGEDTGNLDFLLPGAVAAAAGRGLGRILELGQDLGEGLEEDK